jgi:hypothetical protein
VSGVVPGRSTELWTATQNQEELEVAAVAIRRARSCSIYHPRTLYRLKRQHLEARLELPTADGRAGASRVSSPWTKSIGLGDIVRQLSRLRGGEALQRVRLQLEVLNSIPDVSLPTDKGERWDDSAYERPLPSQQNAFGVVSDELDLAHLRDPFSSQSARKRVLANHLRTL